jgi:hypothetical protein
MIPDAYTLSVTVPTVGFIPSLFFEQDSTKNKTANKV